MKLTRMAKNTYYTARRGPNLPPWTKLLPVFGIVGFALYVGAALFTGSPVTTTPTQVPATGPTVPIGTGATVTAPPSSLPSTTSTTPPSTAATEGDFVTLPGPGGLLVDTPTAAIATARAAAVALFTGDFSDVPVGPNAVVPSVVAVWERPYVGEPAVANIGEDTLTFSFTVDPDGDGSEPVRTITVTVARSAEGTWVWLGV